MFAPVYWTLEPLFIGRIILASHTLLTFYSVATKHTVHRVIAHLRITLQLCPLAILSSQALIQLVFLLLQLSKSFLWFEQCTLKQFQLFFWSSRFKKRFERAKLQDLLLWHCYPHRKFVLVCGLFVRALLVKIQRLTLDYFRDHFVITDFTPDDRLVLLL